MSVFAFASRRNFTPYIPLLGYVFFACFVALIGYQGFHRTEKLIETEKLLELGSIADMKVGQIISWQDGHKKRVRAFSGGALLANEYDRWLQEGRPSGEREQKLLRALAGFQLAHGYASVSLLDRQGEITLTTEPSGARDEGDRKLALEAMGNVAPLFSDIHPSGPGGQALRLSLAAPLKDANKENALVVGVILFQIDPRDFLYPLIQLWPRDSASAETLLIRQEGNEVVFINELRHRKGAALSLRLPIATAQLPAAMATRKETSTMEGFDYRRIPVVAAMRSVPGTSWYMVSKVDKDELFASIHQLKQWAAGLGLGFAVLGGFFFYVWLQGVQARQKQLLAEHEAVLEREIRVQHFAHLTRYASDMILVADEKGKIVEANEAAQQALGYSHEELKQKRIMELHAPLEQPVIPGRVAMLRAKGALRLESTFQRKDGSTFPVDISARMIEAQGIKFIQGIVRDITERKQLEAMRAKIEHVGRLNIAGEMASGMAHELSQPLTACGNYLDACLRGMDKKDWDREALRDAVQFAHMQAERAGRIISHLKEIVRKGGHENAPIDINQVVRDVASLLEDEIRRQGVTFIMTLPPLPHVMACRVEIEQVLHNLSKNAIEAMASSPRRVLHIATSMVGSGEVQVAVSDTGKGVMPDELAPLFNPFYTTKQDGLGLGLVICRSIVENHGGRIWVDAKRELGAKFYFTLPAAPED